ncbi:MAG: ccmI [Proteobacteria bacterium]|nr:ccmI [Pseudomonadota bacterium]
MNVFLLVGGLVFVGVLAALLYPLLKRQPEAQPGTPELRELNLQVLREQLAELDKDLAEGRISEAAFQQSREELERRTLDYVGDAPQAVVSGQRKLGLALALAIGFPLMVGGLYWTLGTPDSVVPTKKTAGPAKEGEHALSQQQITAMVERLALRLQENPNDGAGWLMLARSYAVLGRYPESSAAFGRALSLLPPDAQHYADYADIVAMSQGKKLFGEPEKLVRRALEIDPRNVKALALSGTIAFDRQEYGMAIREWQKVQALLPEDSAAAAGIAGSIRDAENRLAISSKQVSDASPATAKQPPAAIASISGVVELDAKLRNDVKAGDTLFVFARAVNGPKMPVAMMRAKVGDMPLRFTLDDSMAMSPQFRLSTVGTVVVGARISKSGDALARSGDLEGLSAPISGSAKDVRITIGSLVQ